MVSEKADKLSWTINGGDKFFVYGNVHITEGYFDRRGRLVGRSYQIDREGNILPAKHNHR